MIRVLLALEIILTSAPPALACHRFHVWRFPWPQRCGVFRDFRTPGTPVVLIKADNHPAEDKDWSVEITKLPPDLEGILRDRAIERLKEEQK